MKKGIWIGLSVVLLLVLLLCFRAATVFSDNQVTPNASFVPVKIDEKAAVERFAGGIRFPTISYEDPSLFDPTAFAGLHSFIQSSYPLVHQAMSKTVISDYSLVYKLSGEDTSLQPVLFMGHMDVVPVDTATKGQWQHQPFSGDISDGAIWGRGTLDDKVTVFALLEAMEHLLSDGFTPQRTVYFAFGHDEEIGGEQGAAQVAKWFESQNIEFEFVLDEGGAITRGLMVGTDSTVAVVGIAEKGYANIRLTVDDKGGHSSQPPQHTAVGVLSQAIVKLENNQLDTDFQFIQKTFEKIGYYTDFPTRLAMANLWLLSPLIEGAMLAKPSSAASIRTTTAATMVEGSSKSNILPTQAIGVVNYRLMPGTSVTDLVAHVTETIDDPRVKVEAYMANEASSVSKMDSMGYRLIERTIRTMQNDTLVAPYLVQGGTDAKHFSALSDSIYRFMMVELNPETLKQFHGVNEQIPITDYISAIQFYAEMIKLSTLNQ
ncbi:M20 family peptidase [Alteromonas sp. D210916BOD_24]|uniref:M20 family peptidase n=1 Tax=Alteromonas sp. D210916BOD_24 TaxID=3157618 RepID=UPI00399CE189